MAEELTDQQVKQRLDVMEIWGVEFGRLATRIEFEDYRSAVEFADTVFSLAEEQGHYPEVKVESDAVEIDIGSGEGLTDQDFELAERIEQGLKDTNWS